MYVPDKLESMFKQFCCVSDNPVPSGPVAGLLVISSTRTARIWPRTALCLTCPESRLSLARRRAKMGARLEMRNPQEVGGGGREPRRSRLLWELEVVIDASFSLIKAACHSVRTGIGLCCPIRAREPAAALRTSSSGARQEVSSETTTVFILTSLILSSVFSMISPSSFSSSTASLSCPSCHKPPAVPAVILLQLSWSSLCHSLYFLKALIYIFISETFKVLYSSNVA